MTKSEIPAKTAGAAERTAALKNTALSLGADLVGVAEIRQLSALPTNPPDLFASFDFAVSMAMAVPAAIFRKIGDQPTPEYMAIYQTVNRKLDDLAVDMARMIEFAGFSALPVPASQLLDPENSMAAMSHKAVARVAGLGWQGKNLLLITPRFGSRVRLVTLLTDAPLIADSPVKNRCGACNNCRDACPAKAIRGVNTKDHYETRESALHFSRCVEKTRKEFAALPNIGAPICGICIRACPFSLKGRVDKRKKESTR